MHRPHVDDAVPLSRYPEDLIQDLFHVQFLTLCKVESIDEGGAFYPQLLQHSTPGGCEEKKTKSHLGEPKSSGPTVGQEDVAIVTSLDRKQSYTPIYEL